MATKDPKEIVKQIQKRLKQISEKRLQIGIPKTIREEDQKEGAEVFTADIAHINNFGSKTRNIPARPFGTTTIPRYKEQLNKFTKEQLKLTLEGRQTADRSFDRIGAVAAGFMRKNLTDGGWQANSEKTIRIKGSSTPLIDFGHMRNAITWITTDVK
jgi:hypothetical protein